MTLASLGAAALAAGPAGAQTPVPASTQFDITGFIEEATLGPGASGLGVGPGAGAHQGGIIKVNGHVIIVPSETIVIFPASALTWQEIFALSPAPYTGVATGMALADVPAPLTTYEAHVIGNRVLPDANHPTDSYIAGLIYVSQHALNGGAGFINFIDYALGEMRVGGKVNVDGAGTPVNTLDAANPGTRVRINDPVGRFGRAMTPDARFSVDDANPTIIAGTGFPMCLPRTDPAGLTPDPLCPQSQRPLAVVPATGFATAINTNDPRPACTNPPTNTLPAGCSPTGVGPDVPPTALVQVPFEVGDYVSFAGTLVTDAINPTTGPWPGIASTYVSAHTITNNVAVYTFPGTDPAYIMTEVTLIGTGGLTVAGAGEAVIRTRFEGMMTDPTRNVHLYGIDLTPVTGATSDRDFGTIGVDPGPPAGAVKGRWRFRPPCLPFGTVPTKPDKQCVMNAAGTFLPPPREVRSVIEGLQSQNPANPGALTAANGIFYGQYHAPIGEYIFPENIPGTPIVEANFNALDFLALGGYTSAPGTIAGVLSPWPSNNLPAAACTPPVASAGGPYTVAFAGSVPLGASATGTAPVTFTWTAPAAGTISPLSPSATPTYDATGAAAGAVVTVTVTASNACGSSAASSTVTVATPTAPTVNPVAAVTVFSGAPGSILVTGSDPNVPALVPLTFGVTQAGAPALVNLAVAQVPPTSANITFTAPTLPVGQVTPAVVTLTITATNTALQASSPVTTTVTVQPLPDAVTIATAQYRLGQQRLVITANSTVVSPNVVLTLQPYATQNGGVFAPPNGQFTNNGAGLYTITLVGVPEPACGHTGLTPPACNLAPLQVKSNLGGVSPFSALTQVRQ